MDCWQHLPPEVVLDIAAHLNHGEMLRLSSLSKALRSTLAHLLFQEITFSNKERIADSALAAVRSHGQYVTALRFAAYAPRERFDKARLPVPDLSSSAEELLRADKGLLPNLTTLVIDIGHDWENQMGWQAEDYWVIFDQREELDDEVALNEPKYPIRQLTANVFRALTSNTSTAHLSIQNWPPLKSSTFFLDEWHSYLSRLERFEISIMPLDNGAGWEASKAWLYVEIVANMHSYFFEQLDSARDVKLHAYRGAPVGCDGDANVIGHIPLPLRPGMLPSLERLELRYIFLSSDIVDFLASQPRAIQLSLQFPLVESQGHMNIASWAEFFYVMTVRHVKLSTLSIEELAPLTTEEEFGYRGGANSMGEETGEILAIRETLRSDPTRKLFGYGFLDDKYGMLFLDEKRNVEAFHLGDDQRAYEDFMVTVGIE